jgi:membrane-bound metal-dependent hydrolase YbcI (DUF457 family)
MPELLGHLAMGLLFALPAWMLWDGRTAASFVLFVLATSKLPDVDLVLQGLGLPVQHHGVFHTVLFVSLFSVLAGAVAVALFRPVIRRWCGLGEGEAVHSGTVYLFVTGGLVLGGVSHLVADMLAADGYQPIEPFWPIVQETYPVHAIHYSSPWINLWLLVFAAGCHAVVLATAAFPLEHRFRHWSRELAEESDRSAGEHRPDGTKPPSEDV